MRSRFASRRTALVATVALISAVGVVGGLVAARGGGEEASEPAPSPLESIVPQPGATSADFAGSAGDSADIDVDTPTPTDAVTTYLDREISGDSAGSFAVLSSSTRGAVGSGDAWVEGSADRPRFLRYDLASPPAEPTTTAATVESTVQLEPRLDEIGGLVPGRAEVRWSVVFEDEQWRVDLDATTVTPILPSEDGAAVAALHWAQARQRCACADEFEGSLIGSPSIAERLCGVDGPVSTGRPEPLDSFAASASIVAAFGPEADTWARVVPVTTAAGELQVVTAPLGDRWVVVGIGT
jgi:hypothetical protein